MVVSTLAFAAPLSNPSSPVPTGHTLTDIYNLINNTTSNPHTLSPTAPVNASMYSTSDLYVTLANLIDPTKLASTSVTYLGVSGGDTPTTVSSVTKDFSPTTNPGTVTGFTLKDIQDLIDHNTRPTTPAHPYLPATAATTPTLSSLDSIYSSLSTLINPANVATGTTYLGVRGTYVPAPVIAKVVTLGVGANPDVSGDYVEDGDYGDYSTSMSYKQVGGPYYIWSDGNPPSGYKISTTKGDGTNIFWSQGGQVDDTYSSQGSCVGSVTVHDYPYTPPTDPCDGTPEIGTECADGTVYVSSTLRTTSSDAGTYAWGPKGVTTGAIDVAEGRNNITTLKALSADLSEYPAAQACNNSTANGHNDWYLPSSGELNVLFQNSNCKSGNGNCDDTGSVIGGFTTSAYWSSTEFNSNSAQFQIFSDNNQSSFDKDATFSVRCVRTN